MADFPPTALNKSNVVAVVGQDSSKFSVEFEDKTIRTETEAGYQYTRKRHTRPPRRVYTTGFTDLIDAQKLAIETFVRDKNVGADAFTYDDPTTGEEVTVRFTRAPKIKYVGMEGRHLWNIESVEMREV